MNTADRNNNNHAFESPDDVADAAELASTPAAQPIAATPQAAPAVAPATGAVRKPRSSKLLWVAGPLAVAGIAGWLYLTGGRYVSTDNAYVRAEQITISPQVAGQVVEVLVSENQPVKAGDVLFRIDPKPLEISLERLQAQIDAVASSLAGARNGWEGAGADLRAAQADLKHAQQQYDRVKDMRSRGLVAQQVLDDAANALEKARGSRDADVAAVSRAQNMMGGTGPAAALPAYRLAEAQLAQAELDLEHAVVRAPVDGVIGKMDLQPGEFLAVGQPALPLVGTGHLWIEANFKETDLTHVEPGQPAEVRIDSYPGRTWQAHVLSISPASGAEFSVLPAQNATGNWVKVVQRIPMRLEVVAEAGAPILRAGMSADVEIDTGASHARYSRWFGNADGPAALSAR